jgi:rhodanese-related sulfurtransferase
MSMAREASDKLSIEDARREIAGGEAMPVDIRDEEQFMAGHVTGAIRLPKEQPSPELDDLDPGSRLIVFADEDRAASEAVKAMRDKGFDAVAAEGGMKAWAKENFRTQPTEDPDEDTELGAG